jgi:hypothetical protein
MITKLKIQVEEDKIIEEPLKEWLEGKYMIIGGLEVEIVTLRKDLQKKNMQNSSKVLDNIINIQRPLLALGYVRKRILRNKGEVQTAWKAHKPRKGRSGKRSRKEGEKKGKASCWKRRLRKIKQ